MKEKRIILFTDCGDTIINESTEVRKVQYGVVYHAECIPGAKETLLAIKEAGHTIALVADGLAESFHNVMEENGLAQVFDSWTISEEVGIEKPAAAMFEDAMEKLGLTEEDKGRIVMIGNNIKRDIVGAKRFGIGSVLLTWSPRYNMEAETPEEEPDYRISKPEELLELINRLEGMGHDKKSNTCV